MWPFVSGSSHGITFARLIHIVAGVLLLPLCGRVIVRCVHWACFIYPLVDVGFFSVLAIPSNAPMTTHG